MEAQIATEAHIEPSTRPAKAPRLEQRPRVPRRALLCALASAPLLWAAYFPLSWGWLAWFALVPLLTLVRSRATTPRACQYAWACGLMFLLAALQWMRVADDRMYATWIALAVYCSLYFPLALLVLRRIERTRLPLVLSVPMVWTGFELVRAHLLGGFPWYFLSHTQHAFLPLIQISDLGGAYGVTFVVALVNALLFELACRSAWVKQNCCLRMPRFAPGRPLLIAEAVATIALVAASLGYGAYRLQHAAFPAGPTLSLIQGNLDQRIRNQPDNEDPILEHFAALNRKAVRLRPRPDLIVWPETSFPYEWSELSPEIPISDLRANLQELWRQAAADARIHGGKAQDRFRLALNPQMTQLVSTVPGNILVGVNARIYHRDEKIVERYNSALLFHGGRDLLGRYDKIHRVPFGEYVPFREWLPWMNKFAPYDFDYSIRAGTHMTRFPLGDKHFGVVICYEDTDPDLARNYARSDGGAPPVDFLVNISNDGWFNGTEEHEEHLAICRFRAIEARRAIARAVNMGISAVVDGDGRVVALPGKTWAVSKKVAAVVTAAVPLDNRTSLYSLWGDWLAWSCLAMIAAGFAASFVRPRVELAVAPSAI